MPTTFKVVSQRATSRLSPAGAFQDVYEITFVIPSGTVGSIHVPKGRVGDTDYVRAELQEHADALAAVEAL